MPPEAMLSIALLQAESACRALVLQAAALLRRVVRECRPHVVHFYLPAAYLVGRGVLILLVGASDRDVVAGIFDAFFARLPIWAFVLALAGVLSISAASVWQLRKSSYARRMTSADALP